MSSADESAGTERKPSTRSRGPSTVSAHAVASVEHARLRVRVERGVFKRRTRAGETRYEVCYRDADGRQRWSTVATLRDARLLRAQLITRVASGERIVPSKVTFERFAASWLEQQGPRLRPSTHLLYSSYLAQHINPRLGGRTLSSITPDDITALIVDMERGWRYRERDGHLARVEGKPFAAWTIRGVLVVLGRVLGRGVRMGVIGDNPVRRLEREERPTIERREFPILSRDVIATLIAQTPSRYRTLIAVSLLTGMRKGEALGLRWQDIDIEIGLIRVRFQLDRTGRLVEPKTIAAKRDIPIPPCLAHLLAEHKERASVHGHATPTDFVFASETGAPLDHRAVTRRGLEHAIAAANLPRLRWHDLRHVAASALIAEGASLLYLARLLGHASPNTTLAIYAHEFARAEHAGRTRELMEHAFGDTIQHSSPGRLVACREPGNTTLRAPHRSAAVGRTVWRLSSLLRRSRAPKR